MIKTRIKNILPAFLALCITATAVFTVYVAPARADELEDQKKALSSMKDSYSRAVANTNALKSQLSAKQAQIKTKQDEKYLLDQEITVLTEQLKTAESLISEYSVYIEEKNAEKALLQQQYKEQEEMLGSMLRMSYKYGDESYIDIILGAESISDFIQRLDFLAYHMQYSSTLMSEMKETTTNLDEITTNLSAALDSTNAVKEEMLDTRTEVEEKLARVDVLIAELERDASDRRALIAQKEADRKALEKEIAELTATIAAKEAQNGGTPPAKNDGSTLGWPLKGYSMRNLTSSYGYRRDPFTGATSFHNGLDVGAPYGTKIYAAESGTVVRASWYGTYGNCVIIDHGGGLMTLYAHCSGYNTTVGKYVNKGDVIAYVGSTGRSTGNHLHFTVFINGQTTDPGKLLS